jgi:hypothetical protein
MLTAGGGAAAILYVTTAEDWSGEPATLAHVPVALNVPVADRIRYTDVNEFPPDCASNSSVAPPPAVEVVAVPKTAEQPIRRSSAVVVLTFPESHVAALNCVFEFAWSTADDVAIPVVVWAAAMFANDPAA